MKKVLLAGCAVVALSCAAFSPAEASGGCGPFRHRGWDGFCHPGGQFGYGPGPVGYGYGWHRPWGYGWHRHWHGYGYGGGYGWHHRWG